MGVTSFLEGLLQLDGVKTVIIKAFVAFRVVFTFHMSGICVPLEISCFTGCKNHRVKEIPYLVKYIGAKTETHEECKSHKQCLSLLVSNLSQVAIIQQILHFIVDFSELV